MKTLTLQLLCVLNFLPLLNAGEQLTLNLDLENPIRTIPEDYCGLSFETKLLVPDRGMPRYFHGERDPLIDVFRQLGIKNLRIGGNTAERPTVPIPDENDIDHLFVFAKRAGVKVIYTLRMDGNTPEEATRIGQHVWLNHGDLLDCFIIGNEPDKGRVYSDYYSKWLRFTEFINRNKKIPEATYCAPTSTGGTPAFAALMALDEAESGRLAMIGQHFYAGGSSKGDRGRPELALSDMMALGWHEKYQDFHDVFVPHVLAHGHRYRLNETNSYSSGGVYGASNTFAAAIWGLDYLYWWAMKGAAGINFHSGEKSYPGDPVIRKNVYTPVASSKEGVHVQPLGYAIKAFSMVAPGNELLPVSILDKPEDLSLTTYAVHNPETKEVTVTIIHGEYGYFAEPVSITIPLNTPATDVQTLPLQGKPGDIASEYGVTLGGSSISDTGTWNGQWSTLPQEGSQLNFTVPPATAMLIRFTY